MINDENEKLVQEIVKQLIGRVDWKQELVQEMSRDKQSMDMLTQFIATLGLSSSRKLFSETIPQNTFLDLEKLAEEAHPSAEDSNAVLKDIIDLEGYDVVMDRQAFLYVNPKHDITRKITELLNDKE